MDGVELAGGHAVATAQTAKGTGRLARAQHLLDTATLSPVELGNARTALTRSVASHNGNLGGAGLGFHSEDVSHLLHHGLSAHGAEQSFERAFVGCLHAGSGKTRAAGEAAAATVGLRQHFSHLADALVFMNSELLGCQEQDQCCHQSDASKNNHCNQDYIHKLLEFIS